MTGNNKGKAKIVEKSSRSPTYCSDSKQDVKTWVWRSKWLNSKMEGQETSLTPAYSG
jgi:hypothetical protein